jgi:uncharacterized protein YkwD
MSRAAGGGAPRFLLALVVVALVGPGPTALASGDPSSVVYALPYVVASATPRPDLERAALDLVNQERAAKGLQPLVAHAGLRAAARAHAVEMFAYGFFSHRSRDGRTVEDRVRGQGLRARLLAENLAHARDVPAAHRALMASAGHRRNILFPEFRLAGLAVVDGDLHGVMVVQVFADAVRDQLRVNRTELAAVVPNARH